MVEAGIDASTVCARTLCGLLRDAGLDADAVLAFAGTSRADVESDLPVRRPAQLRSIVLAVKRAIARPTLALECGALAPLPLHGAIGRAIVASANLRRALEVLQRFQPELAPSAAGVLHPVKGGAWWVIEPLDPVGELRTFTLEYATASFARLVTRVSGHWPQHAVLEVPWPAPPWAEAYRRLAGALRFGAGRMAWWLPDALLDRPRPTASPSVFADALRDCEASERVSLSIESFTARVQAWFRSHAPRACTLEATAAHFGLSQRTLIRHLAKEGEHFQDLLDAWRREQAKSMLQRTDMRVTEIAQRLGYQRGSNFARCVRRWFGTTPGALRSAA